MLEKISDYIFNFFILKGISRKKAIIFSYSVDIFLYYFSLLFFFSLQIIFLNNCGFLLVASVVFNTLRLYSGGFHCATLGKCIVYTNFLLILLFQLVNLVIKLNLFYFLYFLCIVCIFIIMILTPRKGGNFYHKGRKWNLINIVIILLSYFIISFLCYAYGFIEYSCYILATIILVGLMMLHKN